MDTKDKLILRALSFLIWVQHPKGKIAQEIKDQLMVDIHLELNGVYN